MEKPEREKLVYTVREISFLLGINLPKTYELVRQRDFPSFTIGRRIVVPKAELSRWLQEAVKKD
ncbi:MAG: helix-turn-helix domain-containing protein [Dethiobacteraceae bacterium]|jgi:excisionase family DNA binding protein